MKFDSFRRHLQEELVNRCKRNPTYSLRAFARFLGVDHSTLAKLLNGKRPLGKKVVERLGNRLGLSPSEINQHLTNAASVSTPENEYQLLAADSFQIIADWYHFAILELMRVAGFQSDAKWVSQQLGITVNEVRAAIERLVRVGMIQVSANGKWKLVQDQKLTNLSSVNTSSAHRHLQRQILEKAIVALEETPIEQRNQTSVTMAISTSLLPEAMQKITSFRRELAEFLSRTKKCDQVYHMNVSLYPITKIQRGMQ